MVISFAKERPVQMRLVRGGACSEDE